MIELLVVIGIIGILTGMVTVNLQDARQRARDAQRKADLRQIQNALELYRNDQNPAAYPTTLTWGDDITDGGYMKELPADPLAVQTSWPAYTYNRDLDTLEYTLIACLENVADIDRDNVNNDAICDTDDKQFSHTLTEP